MSIFVADLPGSDPAYVCPVCGGSGIDPEFDYTSDPALLITHPCEGCDGAGEVQR